MSQTEFLLVTKSCHLSVIKVSYHKHISLKCAKWAGGVEQDDALALFVMKLTHDKELGSIFPNDSQTLHTPQSIIRQASQPEQVL